MQPANDRAPSYKVIGAPEIDGNPLTAHLPLAPETDEEALLTLGLRPEFDPQERQLPGSIRRLRINRLRRFYAPVMPVHRRALGCICTSVLDGYVARNPISAQGQRLLHGHRPDLPFSPVITMVAGHSGMGKTTLINRILAYLRGQVWQHTDFRGVPFPETQIVWLRRNVPEHCTVGTLCSTFGDYTDSVLGLKLYAGIFSKLRGSGRTTYLSEIRKIITNHHVGVLVLDEFQNLSLMGVGAKKIISLLVNLRDELGLPIVVVGTYKALHLLKSEMSSARRLVEGGYFDLERPLTPDDEHWQALCQIAWDFQWVRRPKEYDDEVGDALYEVSQGITGIMLTTFASAQVAAIEDGSECVSADLIRKIFVERMKPLHPAIRVLKCGDSALRDQFDDMCRNFWPSPQDEPLAGATSAVEAGEDESTRPDSANLPRIKAGKRQSRTDSAGRQIEAIPSNSKPLLSEQQIQKLVMTDSVKDLIAVLEKR